MEIIKVKRKILDFNIQTILLKILSQGKQNKGCFGTTRLQFRILSIDHESNNLSSRKVPKPVFLMPPYYDRNG